MLEKSFPSITISCGSALRSRVTSSRVADSLRNGVNALCSELQTLWEPQIGDVGWLLISLRVQQGVSVDDGRNRIIVMVGRGIHGNEL
ncbi:hypothetical protein L195_g054378, partial [Trifolium pratense]